LIAKTMESFFHFIQKSPFNMMLFGAMIASAAMLAWPLLVRAAGRGAKEVGTTEAVQLINRRDALVVDVRDGGDFAQGHIANAKHIPLSELADRATRELEKFKNRPIVIADGTGSRAGSAVKLLEKAGFAEVVALRGGFSAWQQASMPVAKKSK
jgi:rhodanese-related sulfurtransferase